MARPPKKKIEDTPASAPNVPAVVVEHISLPNDLPKKLTREVLEMIGGYVMEGLSEDEACVLANFSPEVFKELKQTTASIQMYLTKKAIQFKRNNLRNISSRANDKNSMWLLENLRPEEFGTKKKGGGEVAGDIIGAIIKSIRQSDPGLPVHIQDAKFTVKDNPETLDPQKALR